MTDGLAEDRGDAPPEAGSGGDVDGMAGTGPVRRLAIWEHRAIWRVYGRWGNGPVPEQADARTRTPQEHWLVFLRTIRDEALMMFVIAAAVLLLPVVFESYPISESAGLAVVMLICLVGYLGLVVVPWGWISWRRRSARAPEPPITLRADPDGLTVEHSGALLLSAPWSHLYPVDLHYPAIVYRRTLTGLTVAPLAEDGTVMAEHAVRVGNDDTHVNGTALLRVTIKGLDRAGRLAYS